MLTGMFAGYTLSVSVSILALSGGYVPDKGTLQSSLSWSLSTGLHKLCVVVGRLLGELVVSWLVGIFVDSLLMGDFVVWWLVFDSLLTWIYSWFSGG